MPAKKQRAAPRRTPKYDVFLSYSHRDKAWVRDVLDPHLRQAKLKVCLDERDFRAGAFAAAEMERAVRDSRKTLAVVIQHYLNSEWTTFEEVLSATLDPAAQAERFVPLVAPPARFDGEAHSSRWCAGQSRLLRLSSGPFPQRLDPAEHGRVRVMQKDVERVRRQIRQVVG